MPPLPYKQAPKTSHATETMNESRRVYKCPLNDVQEGVCGCLQFWRSKPRQSGMQSIANSTPIFRARVDTTNSSSSSPSPNLPRQICFFWYHGSCRRGAQCSLAHESHFTWPMSAPPGYVHLEPCKLPMCPLREDLVAGKKNNQKPQLGGQLDGAAVGGLCHSSPTELPDGANMIYGTNSHSKPIEAILRGTQNEDIEIDTNANTIMYEDKAEEDGELVIPYSDPNSFEAPIDLTLSDDEGEDIHGRTSNTEEEKENIEPLVDYEDLPPTDLTFVKSNSRLSPVQSTFGDIESFHLAASVLEGNHEDANMAYDNQSFQLPSLPCYHRPSTLSFAGNFISVFEPGSQLLTGPYFNFSESGSDDCVEEVVVKETLGTQPDPGPLDTTNTTTLTQDLFGNMDYVDLSRSAPRSPISDVEDKPLLSLSHAGTLKHRRTTSPTYNNNDHKRTKRPKLSTFQCEDRTSGWDRRPHHAIDDAPHSNLSAEPVRVQPPQAVRTITKVSLPPSITGHNPNCSLPLCPVRLNHDNLNTVGSWASEPITTQHSFRPLVQETYIYDHDSICDEGGIPSCIKDESQTPPKIGVSPFANVTGVTNDFSSSPRDILSTAQTSIEGHKFRRNSRAQQMPKLTGASRQRFKAQKKMLEKWQTDNMTPGDEATASNEKAERRRLAKQLRRQRKRDKRMNKRHGLEGDGSFAQAVSAETTTKSARRRSKRLMDIAARRRASELFKADLANGGRTEVFDPEAELYRDSFQPIAGFPDLKITEDTRDEMETRSQRTEKAMEMVQSLKQTYVSGSRRPLTTTQPGIRGSAWQTKTGYAKDNADSGTQIRVKPDTLLVDYELPMGEGRLVWDTDLVRRLFGEIA